MIHGTLGIFPLNQYVAVAHNNTVLVLCWLRFQSIPNVDVNTLWTTGLDHSHCKDQGQANVYVAHFSNKATQSALHRKKE